MQCALKTGQGSCFDQQAMMLSTQCTLAGALCCAEQLALGSLAGSAALKTGHWPGALLWAANCETHYVQLAFVQVQPCKISCTNNWPGVLHWSQTHEKQLFSARKPVCCLLALLPDAVT
jgi:hypothetical protein